VKVLVADPIASEGLDILRSHFEVEEKYGLSEEELCSIIGDFDGLVVRSVSQVTAQVIQKGTRLQVIARAGVGVDNIDVEKATQRGIVVVNVPYGNTISAAEHTIALMLSLARHIPQAHALLQSGTWDREKFMGVGVQDKTLGIIGLGNVGTEVTRRAQGLRMKVVAFDPFVSESYAKNFGVELMPLDDLLSMSDFITLHIPQTPKTKGIIGERELHLMKREARIINCARGGLISEQALVRALNEGRIAGAALDVFEVEPPSSFLLQSDNIVATPHLGASTVEAQVSVAQGAADQVVDVLVRGASPKYAINAPFISPEVDKVMSPYLGLSRTLAHLASQLMEGQLERVDIFYEGEIAAYDTSRLKAEVLGSLLSEVCEERVNVVNAGIIAQNRGIKISEHKNEVCDNYASLLSVEVRSNQKTQVSGTIMRGEPHIAKVNDHWVDFVPGPGYVLFSYHVDRPGLIGQVGNITGKADVDISFMQVSRQRPRGEALMVLKLDEPLGKDEIEKVASIPGVHTVKLVKF
jgi:D-3-phosphoglycerate dehydrogenase